MRTQAVPGTLRASNRARSLSPGPNIVQGRGQQAAYGNTKPSSRQSAGGDQSAVRRDAAAPAARYAPIPAQAQPSPYMSAPRNRQAAAVVQRGAISPASPAASAVSPNHHRHTSPPATLSGMTRTEMFNSATPELTRRLQHDLATLTARVADDAPQHLHSVRQIDDMVSEVLARWRRSIRTAIDSMSSLEGELVRKGEALSHAHARLADKDVTLASLEAEKGALRGYAMRLETYVAKLVEQLAESTSGVGAGSGAGTRASDLEAAVTRLLASAREGAGLSPDDTVVDASVRPAAAQADQLTRAVKGATASSPAGSASHASVGGNERVRAFFDALDATYAPANGGSNPSSPATKPVLGQVSPGAGASGPASGALPSSASGGSISVTSAGGVTPPVAAPPMPRSASSGPVLPVDSSVKAALRNIDATLDRALAQVSRANSAGRASSGAAGQPSNGTGSAPGSPASVASGRVASLYVEFEPHLHARATVGMLKAAVAAKAGRRVLSVGYNGVPLIDESSSLTAVSVPLKAYIDVVFDREGANNGSGASAGSSVGGTAEAAAVPAATPATAPAAPKTAVPEPAPQPLPVSKRSPMPRARALMSPAPHAAPQGLGLPRTAALEEPVQQPNIVEPAAEAEAAVPAEMAAPVMPASIPAPAALAPTDILDGTGAIPVESHGDDDDEDEDDEEEAPRVEAPLASATKPGPASSPSPASALSPSAAGFTPLLKRSSSVGGLDRRLARAESARLLSLSSGDDGKATGSLMHAALAHRSQKPQREAIARSIFGRVDVDGSGTIEWSEMQEYVDQVVEKVKGDAQKDISSNGPADGDEDDDEANLIAPDGVPYAVHAAFCTVLRDTGLQAAFVKFDTNGDGVLSQDEFTVMVELVLTGQYGSNGAVSSGASESSIALDVALAAQEKRRADAEAAAAAKAAETAERARQAAATLEEEKAARAAAALEAAAALQALADQAKAIASGAGGDDTVTADAVAEMARRVEALRAASKRGAAAAPSSPAGKKVVVVSQPAAAAVPAPAAPAPAPAEVELGSAEATPQAPSSITAPADGPKTFPVLPATPQAGPPVPPARKTVPSLQAPPAPSPKPGRAAGVAPPPPPKA